MGKSEPQVTSSLVLVLSTAILGYLVVQYIMYHTSLPQIVRWRGYYGCARYPHLDLLFGSDYDAAEAEATRQGHRRRWRHKNFETLGHTYECRKWGVRQFHTANPKNIQTVLALKSQSFGVTPLRQPTAGAWLGHGVFTTDGQLWEQSRSLLRPIFAKAQVKELPRLELHLRNLIRVLHEKSSEVFDMQTLFAQLYLDYSTDFLFGRSTSILDRQPSITQQEASDFIKAFDESLMHVAQAATPWIVRLFRGTLRNWGRPFQASQRFVDDCIDVAIERLRPSEDLSDGTIPPDEKKFVFIDELIKQRPNADRRFLRDQMLNIFFPARDSSGIGISLVIFQLARHPRVWRSVRSEVLNNTHGQLDYYGVKKLAYTNAVINEALRLLAPASLAIRIALEDCELPHGGGKDGFQPLLTPKGSVVNLNWCPVHLDSKIWGDDARLFRPERWLSADANISQRRAWEYLPFMGGPRICPAQQMVTTQYVYILARLAQEFSEIQNEDPVQDFIEQYRMTMQSANGCKVKFVV